MSVRGLNEGERRTFMGLPPEHEKIKIKHVLGRFIYREAAR